MTDTDLLTYPTINYALQGTATSGPQSLTDSCVSSTSLTEYYCQLSTSTTVSNQVTSCWRDNTLNNNLRNNEYY